MKGKIINMSTYARFKSKIKTAKTEDDIREIYTEAANFIEDENLYDKIIKECVRKEIQLTT